MHSIQNSKIQALITLSLRLLFSKGVEVDPSNLTIVNIAENRSSSYLQFFMCKSTYTFVPGPKIDEICHSVIVNLHNPTRINEWPH